MATPLRYVEPALSGTDAHAYLAPLFLGTAGENARAFERALLGVVRDHVHWRRRFHPDDPPSITAADQCEPSFTAALARTEHGLRELSARLQRSEHRVAHRTRNRQRDCRHVATRQPWAADDFRLACAGQRRNRATRKCASAARANRRGTFRAPGHGGIFRAARHLHAGGDLSA